MGSVVEYIENNPQETQRLIGLKYDSLQQLINQAEALHNKKQTKIASRKIRIIAKGGGRKPKLSVPEQILLTLVYLRHLTTFQLLGIQFGVSESTANDIFKYWFPLLRELLPASLLEQVKKNASDHEIAKELLAEFELIVDSCEQARERPREYELQKKFYSGKKKNHTLKNQFIVLPNGKDIVESTAGAPGPKSDINLFRERQHEFETNQKFNGDKAYIGEPCIKTPRKKPKNRELTQEEKQENKEFSRQRILVEHIIRLVKIFRVASERFRLNPKRYEQVILTICGLVRLKIGALILPG
jgi:hypothetical protein